MSDDEFAGLAAFLRKQHQEMKPLRFRFTSVEAAEFQQLDKLIAFLERALLTQKQVKH